MSIRVAARCLPSFAGPHALAPVPLARSLHATTSRAFFNLPIPPIFGSSSSGGGGSGDGEEQVYTEEKVLNYTPRELYSIVADVTAYQSFLPFCTSSAIVPPSRRPRLSEDFEVKAELAVGFMGFEERYTSTVKGTPFKAVEAVASETPLFKTLVTTWSFRSPALTTNSSTAGEDMRPTLVTLDLRYSFLNPKHSVASGLFFGGVSGMMVKAFEQRCRDVYGPR